MEKKGKDVEERERMRKISASPEYHIKGSAGLRQRGEGGGNRWVGGREGRKTGVGGRKGLFHTIVYTSRERIKGKRGETDQRK